MVLELEHREHQIYSTTTIEVMRTEERLPAAVIEADIMWVEIQKNSAKLIFAGTSYATSGYVLSFRFQEANYDFNHSAYGLIFRTKCTPFNTNW